MRRRNLTEEGTRESFKDSAAQTIPKTLTRRFASTGGPAAATATLALSFTESYQVVTGIALPSGSDKLYTASKDETLRIWDCASGQVSICLPAVDGLDRTLGDLVVVFQERLVSHSTFSA
ncbi:hypothetical protein Bca101_097194 [Brassica carinata]